MKMVMSLGMAWLLVACGTSVGDNSLVGSIEDRLTLDFDRVAIYKQGDYLSVEYLRETITFPEKPCKVVIDTRDLGLQGNTTVRGDVFMERFVLARITADDSGFPEHVGGSFHVASFDFQDGGFVTGEVDALFDSGETLLGGFSGVVIEIVP